MNNCPSCFAEPSIVHPQLGLLPGKTCQARQSRLPGAKPQVEIIPDYIKEERRERQDSIEQPHLHGELNKKWVDLHGAEAAKERGFTDKEIKNAKYVYDGTAGQIRYYNEKT